LFAFSRLIMPIAREFNPDFVIVSAGFDAASGDPIGECEVTPFGYSMMLTELMSLAGGKLALVLEGGYNLEVISRCYESCVRVLLKEAAPVSPGPMIASPRAIFAVESAVISQSPYWKCLFPKPAQLCLSENTPQISLPVILDHFWRSECSEKFHLKPMRGLFKSCSESFAAKYTNRVLGSESVHFGPDVLIVFAHESGPVHSGSFISSLCLQAGKISQSLPFASLLQSVHQTNYAMIDVSLPSRTWKLKQPSLGNEVEAQEFNVLFALIWDRLITPSRCKNVFFVAAGSPIFSLANLINTKNDIDQHLRGCFFFSSSLFIPTINQSPQKADWYKRNSYVAVPSQEPIKRPIANAAASFGSCYSAGQWIMSDSAAAVGDFKYEVINFIRTRILLNQ
jgi:histone deacetylase 6